MIHIRVPITGLPESEHPIYELPDQYKKERDVKKFLLSDWGADTEVVIVETGERLLISDIFNK